MKNDDEIPPHHHLIEYKRCGNLFHQLKHPKKYEIFPDFLKFRGNNWC